MSILSDIQTSVVDRLLTVSELSAAKAIRLYLAETPEGPAYTVAGETPDDYPGATVCLNVDEMQRIEYSPRMMSGGTARATFRVPVYIAIYAKSGGSSLTEAQFEAWTVTEAVLRSLLPWQPTTTETVAKIDPLDCESIESILVDELEHGMLLKFWATFGIVATA